MKIRPTIGRQILVAAGLLIVVALIAFLGSLASSENIDGWYSTVEKVAWNPPNWLFGPAWSILYLLIAVSGWLIWRSGWRKDQPNAAMKTLTIYTVQLILNAVWTPTFFAMYLVIGKPAWWIALAIITALILAVIALAVSAWKWSNTAAMLMIPYALWLAYASTLNAGIIALN